MSRGRPAKPGGEAIWIPGEVRSLVIAIKTGDRVKALEEFSKWMENSSKPLDEQNKPNVN